MKTILIQQLQQFYNTQATKFFHTRKRHWPEFDHIVEALVEKDTKPLTIVELGCGDGRLHGFLSEQGVLLSRYQGFDFSEGLISLAQENHPEAEWKVQDMLSALQSLPSESVDYIIAVASIQHLSSKEERESLMNECYRVLRYDGAVITTNWCFSRWFLKRFCSPLLHSMWRSFVEPRWLSNDVLVPWKDTKQDKVYHRYYHIFRLAELRNYFTKAGFIIETSGYISKQGELLQIWWEGRNTFFVARKRVFVES